jgi:hypothetical protein
MVSRHRMKSKNYFIKCRANVIHNYQAQLRDSGKLNCIARNRLYHMPRRITSKFAHLRRYMLQKRPCGVE